MLRSSLRAKPGISSSSPAKFAFVDHNDFHVGLRDDGRVTGGLVEEREFTESVAGFEGRDLAALAAHAGSAVDDHEELVAVLALVHDRSARRDVPVLGPAGDPLEIFAGTAREQRDVLEVIDEHVSSRHGREPTRAGDTSAPPVSANRAS